MTKLIIAFCKFAIFYRRFILCSCNVDPSIADRNAQVSEETSDTEEFITLFGI
jgi:hypothetical protein